MPETGQLVLLPFGPVLPALIAGAGDRAALRFIEFFTVTIRNKNTRACARAAADFLRWCEGRGSALSAMFIQCMCCIY